MSTVNPTENYRKLLQGFEIGMLVTHAADDKLRSRPMAIAEVEDDGTVWFLTELRSGKIEEIEFAEQVNVSLQAKTQFISLSGRADAVGDRDKLAKLWKESFKVWFPGGKDDPYLTLLRVRGESGEYWDNSGSSGLKYLIEAGKAYLSGTRPDVANDPAIHAKVSL